MGQPFDIGKIYPGKINSANERKIDSPECYLELISIMPNAATTIQNLYTAIAGIKII